MDGPRGRSYRDNPECPDVLKLISKMKMNKKQYNDPKKIRKVFAKHRFDPVLVPVGQREVEQQITHLSYITIIILLLTEAKQS